MNVDGLLPYTDRHCAVGSVHPTFTITLKGSMMLLQGELPHPVHLAEDDDKIDWLMERKPTLISSNTAKSSSENTYL